MKFQNITNQGYPDSATPPLSEAEQATMERQRAQMAADDARRGPLGAPVFRRGPGSPNRRSIGLEGVPGDLTDPAHPDLRGPEEEPPCS